VGLAGFIRGFILRSVSANSGYWKFRKAEFWSFEFTELWPKISEFWLIIFLFLKF